MFRKLKFLLLQLIAWLLFFQLARIVFLLYHHSQAKQLSFKIILETFVYGSRMDLSMACYVILVPCLFVLLSVWIPFFRRLIAYKIYSAIALFLLSIIILVDLELFSEWGYRLDSTVLQYLTSPKEAFASTKHLPLFWILVVFLAIFIFILFLFGKLLERSIFLLQPKNEKPVLSFAVVIFFMFLLIIPIRGGVQMQPMNPSWVYFSSNNFANVTALNVSWNFFQDVLDKERLTKNPYQYLQSQKAISVVDSLYSAAHTHVQLIDTSKGKPNVILIVWESFTAKVVGAKLQGKEVTPNINRLKNEGVYFDNLYASGDRTLKGISAILSGYPALPVTSIIRFPSKSAKLTLMSNLFEQHGYSSSFYYGGDPNYDNYKSYWLHGDFNRIVAENDFNSKDKITEWGIADGAVAQYMENDFQNWKEPFFNCWLTLTSHVPYKIPEPPTFQGNDETVKFLNSLHYTDEVLGSFVENCKKQPWWKNTILIITADHGHRLPATGKVVNGFKIPMLWLGGAVEKNQGLVIDQLMSQVDIAATITKQMGWNASAFPFSRDVTDSTRIPFAFFSNSTSFGFVEPKKYFVFDVPGHQLREWDGTVNEKDITSGKAMQQFIYDDYLKK